MNLAFFDKNPVLTQQLVFVVANGLYSYSTALTVLLAHSVQSTKEGTGLIKTKFFVVLAFGGLLALFFPPILPLLSLLFAKSRIDLLGICKGSTIGSLIALSLIYYFFQKEMWFLPIPSEKQFRLYSIYQKAVMFDTAMHLVLVGLGAAGYVILSLVGPAKEPIIVTKEEKDK